MPKARQLVSVFNRVIARTCLVDDHVLWRGPVDRDGYGQVSIRINGRATTAKVHRVVYEHYEPNFDKTLEVDHLCRVRCCVNMLHLEAVTSFVNKQRAQHN